MWLVGILPDNVFYVMFFLGLLGIIVSIFLRNIPVINKYHNPIFLLGLLLTVTGIWYAGGVSKDREYREAISKLEVEIAQAEKRAAEASAKVEYVYRDRVEVVEKIKYRVIGSIRKYEGEIDSNCRISPKAIEILNESASALPNKDTK
jgi:hypothetical protein